MVNWGLPFMPSIMYLVELDYGFTANLFDIVGWRFIESGINRTAGVFGCICQQLVWCLMVVYLQVLHMHVVFGTYRL